MARPVGTRNPGFEARKQAIAAALIPRVVAPPPPSFRELAEAAGVSVPTLRHYFADRDGTLRAVLAVMQAMGAPHLERAATEAVGPLRESLRWFLDEFRAGWGFGVGRMVTAGLVEGLTSEGVGPAFVDDVLEPTLQSAEARLRIHLARGELGGCDVRHAALELVCPVLLALLHQGPLGGARCRPLDVDAFLADHVDRFVRAFGSAP